MHNKILRKGTKSFIYVLPPFFRSKKITSLIDSCHWADINCPMITEEGRIFTGAKITLSRMTRLSNPNPLINKGIRYKFYKLLKVPKLLAK